MLHLATLSHTKNAHKHTCKWNLWREKKVFLKMHCKCTEHMQKHTCRNTHAEMHNECRDCSDNIPSYTHWKRLHEFALRCTECRVFIQTLHPTAGFPRLTCLHQWLEDWQRTGPVRMALDPWTGVWLLKVSSYSCSYRPLISGNLAEAPL